MTARALANAGLASLLALPLLLLSSVALGVPLAVPAAIGVGYLAVSHALAARREQRANRITIALLAGMVGWLFIFLLGEAGSMSHAGLAAAVLAPIFAAAPAFARTFLSGREGTIADEGATLRRKALERVACLDELTPSEQVLILDPGGTVLAATEAARKALKMLPDAFEHHVNSLFEADDLPRLFEALDRRSEHAEPVAVALALAATLAPCADGSVAMRLRTFSEVEAKPNKTQQAPAVLTALQPKAKPNQPRCDLSEAMAFAMRRAKSKARAKAVALTSTAEPDLSLACDRQVGRRVLSRLVEAGLDGSPAGSAVSIVARRLKGVVLLRASSATGTASGERAESEDRFDVTALRSLVEGAGGTLVVDGDGSEIALSVRLALAPEDTTNIGWTSCAKAA